MSSPYEEQVHVLIQTSPSTNTIVAVTPMVYRDENKAIDMVATLNSIQNQPVTHTYITIPIKDDN